MKLAQEWNGRIRNIEQLSKQVCTQEYSPLSATRRAAVLNRLRSKPVFLLGSTTVYARNFLAAATKVFNVQGVIDDHCLYSQIGGVPRISGTDFLNIGNGSVAVCLAFSREGKNYFESLARSAGAELLHYMEAADAFPGYRQDHILEGLARETALHVERLLSLTTRFEDAISIQTLLCILTGRLTYERGWLETVNTGQETMYFGLDFMPLNGEEAVVDCGAFDGDTIEKVRNATADRFKSIVALEPEPDNFAILRNKYSDDKRIELNRVGASNRQANLPFTAALGSFSHTRGVTEEDGPNSIAVTTLDSLLRRPVSTIKIDIEGGELEAIEGAQETIRKNLPKMAIAAYHRPLHLVQIVDLLDQIAPGYSFYLRHHGDFFLETVLYAVPPD
jgi:FkbM family methyltransferase